MRSGSVVWNAETIRLSFDITEDNQQFIPVIYQGVKPDMFREGQGVVVEGNMQSGLFNYARADGAMDFGVALRGRGPDGAAGSAGAGTAARRL